MQTTPLSQKKEGDFWVGRVEEVPCVNCQEKTQDKLLETLKTTLEEALDFNGRDAISAAQSDYQEELLCI